MFLLVINSFYEIIIIDIKKIYILDHRVPTLNLDYLFGKRPVQTKHSIVYFAYNESNLTFNPHKTYLMIVFRIDLW